ncbi:MAG: acetyl-CoA--acetoacetyl-CoA transferase subunit alpha [Polynucleobacter sp. 24-46-87]|jgi:acetate CoA/acetoacetate CoA-transferase alpha subunit|nr:MAG: acetyl-CoA--acetoacetyl-CoA transferase subunit alpha [Polynucleobacter sp. 32-46-5]OYY59359.1 MAG: acetyl-CoA--acetoacetyl-CoA transferase subunit alpha [Polynucleobacter sp. 35-46-207]OYZ39041.1 MAG: acetyl-CoA--acetoacetyl-CoA transferase subunit alpha [Polynucleobacter sp. 16-46-70]OZA15088.1 MAG: acetyl-CoA--acetoacetyl-CoA transferase subunit alpha [Polynucleobacter sp. 24-46-87]OZA42105.1 MAG: acetyl-CoA--acetoacetyl-CoA transferase subunit alpha [Polynucleobacter sp. 17-46-58]O
MKQAITVDAAIELIPDGASIMIGGFMGIGSPHRMIDALVEAGKKNLTVIANDTGKPNYGIGKLIASGQVKHVIASHIGLNPETQAKMFSEEISVDLVPQGNLAERIRAAGFGLGGVLVQTGIGTLVEDGKQVINVNGKNWLLELPIAADFALIHAHQADYLGNLTYQLTATNFNPVMAMAAKVVLCEANEIVPVGMISPNEVITPGAIVSELIAMPHKHH